MELQGYFFGFKMTSWYSRVHLSFSFNMRAASTSFSAIFPSGDGSFALVVTKSAAGQDLQAHGQTPYWSSW